MYPGATINAQTWDVLCGNMLKGPQTTSKQWSPPTKGSTTMMCQQLGMVVRIWQVLLEGQTQVQLCLCRIKDDLVDQCLWGMAMIVQGGQKSVLPWAYEAVVVCPWGRIHWTMIRFTFQLQWAYHRRCHATMVSTGKHIHNRWTISGLNSCRDQSRSKPSWVLGRRTSVQTFINKTWPMLVWVDVYSDFPVCHSFLIQIVKQQ